MMPRWYFLFPPTYRHSIPYHVVLYVPHVRDSRLHTTHGASTAAPDVRRPTDRFVVRDAPFDRRRVANGDATDASESEKGILRDSIAVWERARRRHGGGIVWITLHHLGRIDVHRTDVIGP